MRLKLTVPTISIFFYFLPSLGVILGGIIGYQYDGVIGLIRDVTDRGVLLLCDPRLLKRSYGQLFLDSVPPMKRTRDIKDVNSFFARDTS